MQLRHTRFVDPDFGPDLLHRHIAVVVEPDHLTLPRRQRDHGRTDPGSEFPLFAGLIRRLRLRWDQCRREHDPVDTLSGRQWRGRLDRLDADDGPSQASFVRTQARGQVGDRRFVTQLTPQRLPSRFELPANTPEPARPGVAPQCVDHRAADAPLRKGFELDAP